MADDSSGVTWLAKSLRLTYSDLETKNYFLAYLFYYACVCTAKAAYLVFFAELYSKIETKARPLLYATMVFWALSSLTGFLMFFLWCKPLSANWYFTMPESP